MRVLFVAATMATLLAGVASAQTSTQTADAPSPPSTCASLAAAPSLPDGASANNEAMTAGNATFTAWVAPSQQALACRRAEIEAVHTRWQALVNEYNAQAQSLNATRSSWDGEIEQYNERGSGRPRNASTSGH